PEEHYGGGFEDPAIHNPRNIRESACPGAGLNQASIGSVIPARDFVLLARPRRDRKQALAIS
ncbi:hypothetical protein, partial [Lactobacillus crispatus]|uniref:hypothetical protein n=1 Tax=Lactobacillus crispatus TaxID=47770 RepID=UPI00197BFCB5